MERIQHDSRRMQRHPRQTSGWVLKPVRSLCFELQWSSMSPIQQPQELNSMLHPSVSGWYQIPTPLLLSGAVMRQSGQRAAPVTPVCPWNPVEPAKPCAPSAPVLPLGPVPPLAPEGPLLPVTPGAPWRQKQVSRSFEPSGVWSCHWPGYGTCKGLVQAHHSRTLSECHS